MASSLISKLNTLLGSTPDQIATALNSRGWVRGSEMTHDVWEKWGRDCRLQLTVYNGTPEGWWQHNERTRYHCRDWSVQAVNDGLAEYWFRPYEDIHDGIWPDLDTELACRQDS